MKRLFAACALSAWIAAVQAQGTPSPGSTLPPPPPTQSPGTSQTPSGQPAPQRGGFIAPIVDIRIQGDGIGLPKGVGEAPPPEKPPAK